MDKESRVEEESKASVYNIYGPESTYADVEVEAADTQTLNQYSDPQDTTEVQTEYDPLQTPPSKKRSANATPHHPLKTTP